ncbi:putative type VI secretion system effector [Siccibacter colletis]|uniref:putative type VI secretion system effector n=1 Tax=Siccibacter colletis TaxID=1505757 RepID=UPI0028BE9144|nr:putative type VI secretion system effector [Siccibacter colletis]WNN47507.1 putative type VI secretion system effector [Siccibacter colletis]
MTTPSAEALRRFKRVDLEEILEDAQQRLSQTPEETLQQWRDNIFRETKGYSDLKILKSYMESSSFRLRDNLKSHEKYLASHREDEFNERGITLHNEYIDDESLELVFMASEIDKFPPMPVLPPPEPLIKVCGVVEDVEFIKARAWFDAQAYMTTNDLQAFKAQLDSKGIVGAMLTNSFSGSSVSSYGSSDKVNCLYTKGKINGKTFSGWFGMTDIRPGDLVEMAAMSDGDNYLVYAIINITRGTISLTPKCYKGRLSNSFHLVSLFTFAMVLVPFLYPFLAAHAFLSTLCIYIATSLFLSIAIYRRGQNEEGNQYKLYGRIADALGFPGGERFDLLSHAGKIIKKKKDAGEIRPRKEGEIPVPQGGSDGYVYEYFYYY